MGVLLRFASASQQLARSLTVGLRKSFAPRRILRSVLQASVRAQGGVRSHVVWAVLFLTVLALVMMCATAMTSAHIWKLKSWRALFGNREDGRVAMGSAVQSPQAEGGAAGTITTFSVTGAGTGMYQGTVATCINAGGAIGGFYTDTAGMMHGFVRAAGGSITTFDAPGAGTATYQGTIPISINTAGTITGTYLDAHNASHGFVRTSGGTITTFNAPSAGTTASRGTVPTSINDAGQIVGFYATGAWSTVNTVYYGSLRSADGTSITSIKEPNAGTVVDPDTGRKQGTWAYAINASGEIAGSYVDSNMNRHGFVRSNTGVFTSFDPPNAGTSTTGSGGGMTGTQALSIDTAGDVVGVYTDTSGLNHGFIRLANGTISAFDAPGAGTSQGVFFEGTFIFVTDPGGNYSAGAYTDSNAMMQGFVGAFGGTVSSISVPGAAASLLSPYGYMGGTGAFAVNTSGMVAGVYSDANGTFHGFLFTPTPALTAQTITFPAPPSPVTYGVTPITLSATASSDLPVSFSLVSGPGTVSGVNNSTLTITGAGTVVVAANQAGNASYGTAPQATQNVVVDPAPLAVVANNAAQAAVGNPTFSCTAPSFVSCTITGFVNGDTSAVVSGTATLVTTATTSSPVGTYPIAFTTENLTAANYTFNYVSGVLEVYNTSQPLLLGLSPASATAGSASFTLTVNGANFNSNSVVLWNGAVRTTTYVSSTQLTASILAQDIANESTSLITVANPAPNGGSSPAQPLAVMSATPVAKITAVTVVDAANGSGNYVVSLTGTDFVSGSAVQWNGTSLTASDVSPWQISEAITAAELAAQPAVIMVNNPSGTSTAFELR